MFTALNQFSAWQRDTCASKSWRRAHFSSVEINLLCRYLEWKLLVPATFKSSRAWCAKTWQALAPLTFSCWRRSRCHHHQKSPSSPPVASSPSLLNKWCYMSQSVVPYLLSPPLSCSSHQRLRRHPIRHHYQYLIPYPCWHRAFWSKLSWCHHR